MSLKEKYSADNPANRVRPGPAFVFSHPAHALALFFGAGCLRPGPGTWGTAAGLAVWVVLVRIFPLPVLLALMALLFVRGALASQRTGDDLGAEDAGCIVVDEVAGVWLTAVMLPQNWTGWLAAFVAFRIFDIFKLPPASWVDSRLKNGWAVMLDDLFAALWAVAAVLLIDRLAAWAGVPFMGIF